MSQIKSWNEMKKLQRADNWRKVNGPYTCPRTGTHSFFTCTCHFLRNTGKKNVSLLSYSASFLWCHFSHISPSPFIFLSPSPCPTPTIHRQDSFSLSPSMYMSLFVCIWCVIWNLEAKWRWVFLKSFCFQGRKKKMGILIHFLEVLLLGFWIDCWVNSWQRESVKNVIVGVFFCFLIPSFLEWLSV